MLNKSNNCSIVISFIYLLLFFMYKYSANLFMNYWQINTLTQKINLGDITITQSFIISILITILINYIYYKLSINKILDNILNI